MQMLTGVFIARDGLTVFLNQRYRATSGLLIAISNSYTYKITVELPQAPSMVRQAWRCVTHQTVCNCWPHTQILPVDAEPTDCSTSPPEAHDNADDIPLAELQRHLHSFQPNDDISSANNIKIDAQEETSPSLDDDSIVEIVKNEPVMDIASSSADSEENDNSPADSIPTPTASSARASLRIAIAYFELIGNT